MKPRKTPLIRNSSMLAFLISSVVFITGCKKDISSETPDSTTQETEATTEEESNSVSAQAVAYEGYGANAVGGSNSSTVYHVTNLNSSGSGSFRGGLGSNRTIVFDVSGTITGNYDLTGYTYLTVDGSGQTVTFNGNNSGGDVISIAGSNTHHIILKNVNVTNAANDGINVLDGAHDVVVTNCTSWGNRDGNIDVAGANNVTVQYCIMGPGASGWSGSMLITATNVSVHHNLYSPATSNEVGERNPLVHCNYSAVGNPNADIRNNVIWKYGRSGGTGSGYGTAIAYNATANVINNYYYTTGPSTSGATSTSDGYGSGATGKAYMSGNVSGNSGANPNGSSNHAIYSVPAVTTQDACSAAAIVKAQAGARPLNSVAQSIINGVTLPNCSSTPPPNQSPTANAGSDKTITLPTSSVSLSGSGSDPDGTIASYAWSKVSGSGGTIASSSSATTNITGLIAGTYVFSLRVTDNKGATATDNVTVTVNNATGGNTPPTVNAGTDKTITLPTSSVVLTGSASDPNGSIASLLWSKVSGSGGTISSPTSATTTISGLSAGSYVFSLRATDNQGASTTDNVTITVNSAPPSGGGGYGTLTYSQGYDESSSVSTSSGPRNTRSSSKYATGPYAFRTEVRASDANKRGEMVYTSTSQNPNEGVVEYDVYYENWTNLGGGGHTIEWLPKTSGAGAIVSLQNYEGKFDVVRAIGSSVTRQSGTLTTVTPNTWYKMRWEFKWSSGTDGYLRLYINNSLYYSYTGKTADGSGQTLRVGQLRWSNSTSPSGTAVVYYDNLKVYSK